MEILIFLWRRWLSKLGRRPGESHEGVEAHHQLLLASGRGLWPSCWDPAHVPQGLRPHQQQIPTSSDQLEAHRPPGRHHTSPDSSALSCSCPCLSQASFLDKLLSEMSHRPNSPTASASREATPRSPPHLSVSASGDSRLSRADAQGGKKGSLRAPSLLLSR